jgi:inner membrane protein
MTLRFILTAFAVLLMLIPLAMVQSIVAERHGAYQGVVREISSHWGREQVLTGPILIVPYSEAYDVVETQTGQGGEATKVKRRVSRDFHAVILPDHIRLVGDIEPDIRRRGIYRSLVYSQRLKLTGNFTNIANQIRDLSDSRAINRIRWDESLVVVGLSDPQGIAAVAPLRFGTNEYVLEPGTRTPRLLRTGFHAPVHVDPVTDADFNLEMRIKGSEGFRLAPIGRQSDMTLSSKWSHPSFYGAILPTTREITDAGFEAEWSIPHLVRSYPQYWILEQDDSPAISSLSVGVRLFEPITLYTEATRAVKYGFLFIALTFLSLMLIELAVHVRPSMVQYVMIGLALAVFYLLLIALAEHIGFNKAYAIAAVSVIAMNTLYCLSLLGRKLLALIVTLVLTALYAVLFVILRAEDFALLAGSILLLIAVAVTMYFTRNLHRIRH